MNIIIEHNIAKQGVLKSGQTQIGSPSTAQRLETTDKQYIASCGQRIVRQRLTMGKVQCLLATTDLYIICEDGMQLHGNYRQATCSADRQVSGRHEVAQHAQHAELAIPALTSAGLADSAVRRK